jgi:hypothetical protein
MYVKEYLGFIAGLHKIEGKKERAAEIIDQVALQEELSQQQSLRRQARKCIGNAHARLLVWCGTVLHRDKHASVGNDHARLLVWCGAVLHCDEHASVGNDHARLLVWCGTVMHCDEHASVGNDHARLLVVLYSHAL